MTRRRSVELITERNYDAIVVGTGLCESILAAALALAGSSVLHLDSNDFYGSAWATVSLSQLDNLIHESNQASEDAGEASYVHDVAGSSLTAQVETEFGQGYEVVPLRDVPLHTQLFPQGVRAIPVPAEDVDPIPVDSRSRFWLDLVPRPIMAAGRMVNLLIKTNVGHYIDFRALDALYVEFGGQEGLQRVPGSRADVFQNRFISMLEKRLLMRFVKKCYGEAYGVAPGDGAEQSSTPETDETQSFEDEMSAMGVTDKLQQFLTHSIAFCSGREGGIPKDDGIAAVRTYQQSMAKFGTRTPFLYANHGSGELAQAFCRLCAVHGGVYVLRRGAAAVVRKARVPSNGNGVQNVDEDFDDARVGVVTTENELISCKHLFLGDRVEQGSDMYLNSGAATSEDDQTCWRAMAITDNSITREEDFKRVMVTVPRGKAGNPNSAVRLRQLDSSVMVCPPGFYLLYAETVELTGTEEDVIAVLRQYSRVSEEGVSQGAEEATRTEDNTSFLTEAAAEEGEATSSMPEVKPRMLWGVTYGTSNTGRPGAVEEGICTVSGPKSEHDADLAIEEAKRCFQIVHPADDFFLVRVPEVEDEEEDADDPQPAENGFHEDGDAESRSTL